MGNLTEHFSRWEFVCPHCRGYRAPAANLLLALERLREAKGTPLRIVSGYRCAVYNARVGGIATSQHRAARAVDIPRGYCSVAEAKAAGFIGIGVRAGGVIHVDVTPGRRPFVFDD